MLPVSDRDLWASEQTVHRDSALGGCGISELIRSFLLDSHQDTGVASGGNIEPATTIVG